MDMVDGKQQLVAASKLDAQTQWLMKFIFDNDMFRDAMKSMDIGMLAIVCLYLDQLICNNGNRYENFYIEFSVWSFVLV